VLLGFLVLISTGSICRASEVRANGKNVLVLFGGVRPDNRHLFDLIETDLRVRVPGPITFYDAYLIPHEQDSEIDTPYQESQAETFRLTYEHTKFDLVIAVYGTGVSFATQYRDRMFPGVPIMFAGVGIKSDWEWTAWPGVPGATFAIGLSETIDLALKLHPDTKRVAIVAGPDWGWIKEMHSELSRRNLEAIDIINDHPTREILQRVATLPPNTVALLHGAIEPTRSDFGSREVMTGVSKILPTYSAGTTFVWTLDASEVHTQT
jgi:hypothetical protein